MDTITLYYGSDKGAAFETATGGRAFVALTTAGAVQNSDGSLGDQSHIIAKTEIPNPSQSWQRDPLTLTVDSDYEGEVYLAFYFPLPGHTCLVADIAVSGVKMMPPSETTETPTETPTEPEEEVTTEPEQDTEDVTETPTEETTDAPEETTEISTEETTEPIVEETTAATSDATSEEVTDAPVGDTENTTQEPDTTNKTGCGSSMTIMIGTVAMAAAACLGVDTVLLTHIKKKKSDE